MDKPAMILLEINKITDHFWSGLAKVADKKTVHEYGEVMLLHLNVTNVSLDDHQPIRFKTKINNGKEVQFWVPRNLVKMISESKTDLSDAFSFVGKTTK
jgi:hypothetical protein